MLPSEFPEVQGRQHLKRLLAEHGDMQFIGISSRFPDVGRGPVRREPSGESAIRRSGARAGG
jgi:hypothetical protein